MEATRPLKQTGGLVIRPAGEALLPAERLWARLQAEQLLGEARIKAQRLLQEAGQRVARLEKKIKQRLSHELRRRHEHTIGALLAWRRREREYLRRAALDAAVAMAQRILRKHLELRPGDIEKIVAGVIEESPLDRPLTVMVHPEALAQLAEVGRAGDVRFEACADLDPGDCLVVGDFGQIEGRITVRLEVLRRGLERMAEDVFNDCDEQAIE
jgi:flagellar biosynthesis/type III secretory pathway protein FliH